MRYGAVPHLDRASALERLKGGGREAAEALYSIALHDHDDDFALRVCLEAFGSNDQEIRNAAASAVGEMAVVSGRKLDFAELRMRLEEVKAAYPELRGRIDDSLDDLGVAEKRDGANSAAQSAE